ncbi:hypothetical protein J3F83DRAFT_717939 [Trichoderma novae-zelandiae]
MQLSALLVLLPLASALPTAPAVEGRALQARDDTDCKQAQDDCLSKCKPSFNPLSYIYCVSSCHAAELWCKADENDD